MEGGEKKWLHAKQMLSDRGNNCLCVLLRSSMHSKGMIGLLRQQSAQM